MPEGPSIVILKQQVAEFKNKKVLEVTGNTKTIDKDLLLNKKMIDFKSWGKHFLICFPKFTVKIHFLLYGSYLINETKSTPVRLGLKFSSGEINFYSCSVKMLEDDPDEIYDWSADIMNDNWDATKAFQKLKSQPETLVCDALLDQNIFAGVGNIIKNEVLYGIRVHPESKLGKIPDKKLKELIKEARIYSFQFLEWKLKYELKKHWLAHTKTLCLRCNLPIIRKHLGKTHRRTFFCNNCQHLYQ